MSGEIPVPILYSLSSHSSCFPSSLFSVLLLFNYVVTDYNPIRCDTFTIAIFVWSFALDDLTEIDLSIVQEAEEVEKIKIAE